MITIPSVVVAFDGRKALIAFLQEDVPPVLQHLTRPRLQALPARAEHEERLMVVVEGESPAGPLVVAMGPMSAESVRRIHDTTDELTLCAAGAQAPTYGIVLDLRTARA